MAIQEKINTKIKKMCIIRSVRGTKYKKIKKQTITMEDKFKKQIIELNEEELENIDGGGKWGGAFKGCAAGVASASGQIIGATSVNPTLGAAYGLGACIYGGFWGYVLHP